jgi:hypothetical protein
MKRYPVKDYRFGLRLLTLRKKAGLTQEEMASQMGSVRRRFETGWDFAAQVLAVLYEWGMDPQDERLNPNGGAIALGQPLGCSGARILTTLLHEMGRCPHVEQGLATMCIGVGQDIAMLVEKV